MLTFVFPKDMVSAKMVKKGKLCPSCNTKVGARTKICRCGHNFEKIVKTPRETREERREKVKQEKEAEKRANRTKEEKDAELSKKILGCKGRIILYPGEPCPVKLVKTDLKSIRQWRSAVIEYGQQKNVFYAPSAIRYFVRDFFLINTPKNQEANWHLEDILREETEDYKTLVGD